MELNITIEVDKEFATVIKDIFREISEGITNLQGSVDKPDFSVSTESVPEPKKKPTKPATKRKNRAKQTLRGSVLKVIKQNKDGISRKELLEKTGFSKRQITDYVYQLKKMQKIEATKEGLFKPL